MASSDLTSIARVKDFLKLASNVDDGLLQALVTRLSLWTCTRIGRDIIQTNYDTRFNGWGGDRWPTPQYPILSVTSITIGPFNSTPVPLSATTDYWFDEDMIYLVGRCFTRGQGNCRIQYTAGYLVVPEDLDQAVAELVAFAYKERDRLGVTSKNLAAGESINYITKEASSRVLSAFDNWRNVRPI